MPCHQIVVLGYVAQTQDPPVASYHRGFIDIRQAATRSWWRNELSEYRTAYCVKQHRTTFVDTYCTTATAAAAAISNTATNNRKK